MCRAGGIKPSLPPCSALVTKLGVYRLWSNMASNLLTLSPERLT